MDDKHAKRAFIPTIFEIVVLTFVSLAALIAVNILPALRAGHVEDYSLFSDYTRDFVERLVAPIENQQTSNIIVIMLWLSVGVISYLVVWVIATIIHAYQNDLPPSHGFILPRGIIQRKVWYSALGRVLVRVLATIGLLYWTYLLLGSIFPFASSSFLEAVTELPQMWPLVILSSVLLTAISLFVTIILLRSIFLRERVFGS